MDLLFYSSGPNASSSNVAQRSPQNHHRRSAAILQSNPTRSAKLFDLSPSSLDRQSPYGSLPIIPVRHFLSDLLHSLQ